LLVRGFFLPFLFVFVDFMAGDAASNRAKDRVMMRHVAGNRACSTARDATYRFGLLDAERTEADSCYEGKMCNTHEISCWAFGNLDMGGKGGFSSVLPQKFAMRISGISRPHLIDFPSVHYESEILRISDSGH
jgi:hypothetical protein